jgi:hypothetical protein
VLFVEGDQGAESGMANVRLRLSDSIESFSGNNRIFCYMMLNIFFSRIRM